MQEGEPQTIIQISDIHYDPIYTPDGNAECGEPMCCRSKQGTPKTPEAAAGFWGDYRYCDLSWHAFEDALAQIKKAHTVGSFTFFQSYISLLKFDYTIKCKRYRYKF